jgi:uncharacterized protein DUF2844
VIFTSSEAATLYLFASHHFNSDCAPVQQKGLVTSNPILPRSASILTLLLSLICPTVAWCALGDTVSSVEADRVKMKGAVRVQQVNGIEVHEISDDHGTHVREFVSPQGSVFAVAWEGQFIPDLQQVLGKYFDQYSEAVRAQKASYVGRRPLNIQLPGLIVQMTGHMRAYSGRAYVPAMVPAGVALDSIR